MFLGFCALLIVVMVPLTGGNLRRLAEIRLRWVPLALVALAVQVLIITIWPGMPHGIAVGAHIASYGMLAAVVWANRRLPGMLLIALGAGANALAITVNDGTLPASAGALHAAGIHPRVGFQNSGVVAHPHLAWLGDIMVTPSWLPFQNMLSVGDLVLLSGALVLVMRVTHRPAPVAEKTGESAIDDDVRGLDDSGCEHAGLELEVVGRLPAHQ
ncbi:MAG TPA: DUF5317 family protein [Mycobacteriales bacterium]|nr:DUF5317 family protein [Mycobacteriales bacterium]